VTAKQILIVVEVSMQLMLVRSLLILGEVSSSIPALIQNLAMETLTVTSM